jgi:hypothetical protein
MSEQVLVGCSGWNYGDTPDKGGWTGVFYPDKDTKRLGTIPNSLTQKRWILYFMKNSIPK